MFLGEFDDFGVSSWYIKHTCCTPVHLPFEYTSIDLQQSRVNHLLQESPMWLLDRGYDYEAWQVLQRIGRINGKEKRSDTFSDQMDFNIFKKLSL